MDEAWAGAVESVADQFANIDGDIYGGAYVAHVTGLLPYTYELDTQDVCPLTVCDASFYRQK